MEETSNSIYNDFYGSLDLNDLELSSIPAINFDSVEKFYNCKKCYQFPEIAFTNNGTIKFKYKCNNSEEEEISYNKIKERIIGVVKDDETKKRMNCYCRIHNQKFLIFCANCEENKCRECANFFIGQDHHLINLNSNVLSIKSKIKDMQKKIEEIKNDKASIFSIKDQA